MPQNTNHRKCHASKITKGVTDKDLRRTPIVSKKTKRDTTKGQEQHDGKQVIVETLRIVGNLNSVVDQDCTGNDIGLTDLEAVDARIDIDGVCAKDSQHAHVQQIPESQIDHLAIGFRIDGNEISQHVSQNSHLVVHHEQSTHLNRQDNGRRSLVTTQEGKGRDSRQDQLVPPWPVQDIIGKPKKEHEANGKECRGAIEELVWIRVGVQDKREN